MFATAAAASKCAEADSSDRERETLAASVLVFCALAYAFLVMRFLSNCLLKNEINAPRDGTVIENFSH